MIAVAKSMIDHGHTNEYKSAVQLNCLKSCLCKVMWDREVSIIFTISVVVLFKSLRVWAMLV